LKYLLVPVTLCAIGGAGGFFTARAVTASTLRSEPHEYSALGFAVEAAGLDYANATAAKALASGADLVNLLGECRRNPRHGFPCDSALSIRASVRLGVLRLESGIADGGAEMASAGQECEELKHKPCSRDELLALAGDRPAPAPRIGPGVGAP